MGKQVLLIEVSDALSGQIPCHLGKYEMAAVGAPRVVFTPPPSDLSDRLKTIEDDYKGLRLSANAMNTEPWVTAEQVAQHLGVVKDTVYRWLGRLWKFQLSEVDEWVRVGGADEDAERRNADHTAAPGAGRA